MNVIATITSKFGTRGYKSVNVGRVQTYEVDSALDTDTDQFTLDIGDPAFQLIQLLRRDEEVRISISANWKGDRLFQIMKGYGDQIGLTHDGTLSIQGRDLSAAAVDTTAVPFNWRNARPSQIIKSHAAKLGFSQFAISPVQTIRSLYTDGSESEWAFWYRMVRKKQMWIWCGPAGALYVDQLNYAAKPTYYFGVPNTARPNKLGWIRVIAAEIRKNTQTRIGEVWVFGETGKVGFGPVKATDSTIRDWIKKPIHIITTDAAHTNRAAAIKEAQEEIFEGIVGSLEITLTIADPGFPIRQNTVAELNLPNGYSGEFFVVGIQLFGGADGGYQIVRLREKKFALTKRVPQDPAIAEDTTNVSATEVGSSLNLPKEDWGTYFVNAAKAWHGAWDLSLFLAALLSICKHETNFMNVREGNSGGPEWTPPPSDTSKPPSAADQHHHADPNAAGPVQAWRRNFANTAGNPLNPFSREAGVGPMQLTDIGWKVAADKRGGVSDEYVGGRWMPEANIFIGASVLAAKLNELHLPPTEANFWLGIEHYNGSGPAAVAYMKRIKADILTNWLPNVKTDLSNAKTLPGNSTKTIIKLANAPAVIRRIINYAERQLGDPYRLGASGPDLFDCSGLTWAAYNAAGLSDQIGGRQDTYGYWQNGKGWGNLFRIVEKAQLLPGDMVFFDNYSETPPAHMGIYYQNGQMIVAPHTGDVVKIESISVPGLGFMGGMRLKGIWPVTSTQNPVAYGHSVEGT